MPLIYRAMMPDGHHPAVGPEKKKLGVQIPGDLAEVAGRVAPGTGGMSVAPAWRDLPLHRIPRRLKHLEPKASGNNQYECWKMGEGPFVAGAVAEGLSLRIDRSTHGLVEPAFAMSSREYQESLAATRDQWEIDQETRT
jgi:hypothetical protein